MSEQRWTAPRAGIYAVGGFPEPQYLGPSSPTASPRVPGATRYHCPDCTWHLDVPVDGGPQALFLPDAAGTGDIADAVSLSAEMAAVTARSRIEAAFRAHYAEQHPDTVPMVRPPGVVG